MPHPHMDRNSSFPKLGVHRTALCTQVTKLLVKAVRVGTVKMLTPHVLRPRGSGLSAGLLSAWRPCPSLLRQPICSLPLVLAPAGSQVRHRGMLRTWRWSPLTRLCSFCFFLLWLASALCVCLLHSVLCCPWFGLTTRVGRATASHCFTNRL